MQYLNQSIEYLKDSYKSFIHRGDVGDFPLADRVVSYAIPVIASGSIAYLLNGSDNYKFEEINSKGFFLPAIVFYVFSQAGIDLIKPHAEQLEKSSWQKSILDFCVKFLDTANNIALLAPTMQILPAKYCINSIMAMYVMPEILKGIESDIKVFIDRYKGEATTYESEVSGKIYANVLAATLACNLAKYMEDQTAVTATDVKSGALEKAIEANKTYVITAKNGTNFEQSKLDHTGELINRLTEGLSYTIAMKLLIGKTYKKDEVCNDITKSFMNGLLYKSNQFPDWISNKIGLSDDKHLLKLLPQFFLVEEGKMLLFDYLIPTLEENEIVIPAELLFNISQDL